MDNMEINNTEPKFVIHYEAHMPPRRQFDRDNGYPDRGDSLTQWLVNPGNWNSEVVRNGKRITWTTTYPASYDLSDIEAVSETIASVGYHCSDTIGPKTRKAILRYRFEGSDTWSSDFVCPGAW